VPLDVVVVDQHNFHTFQPLLYQVATTGLDAADVAYPIRTILRRYATIRYLHARTLAVDVDKRIGYLSGDTTLADDYLVVATGATGVSFGVPGVVEHALSLYAVDDAVVYATRFSWHWRQLTPAVRAVTPEGGGSSLSARDRRGWRPPVCSLSSSMSPSATTGSALTRTGPG
jgi:NADH dehydrogenase FAD-containing subunit